MRRNLGRFIRWILAALLVGVGIIIAPILWGAYNLPSHEHAGHTLATMYADDQEARRAGFADIGSFINMVISDWQRLQKVKRMINAEMLSDADDYYHAAMIVQHGSEPADYLLAQELAQQASDLGDPRGVKLRALAEDRYLVSTDQPQLYGSQSHCTATEGWILYPVDPDITDLQRQETGMPTLEEQQGKIEQLQQITNGDCALTAELMQEVAAIMES